MAKDDEDEKRFADRFMETGEGLNVEQDGKRYRIDKDGNWVESTTRPMSSIGWQHHQRPVIVWLTGLSAAGKSTIATLVGERLRATGHVTALLDGDDMREGLNRDLGFGEADRMENIRRAGEVARLMTRAGLIVICSFISPYRAGREQVRRLMPAEDFIEVFVDAPLAECMRRDPKGLYAKRIRNFTGIDAPYEEPEAPELHVQTVGEAPALSAGRVVRYLAERGIISGRAAA